MDKSYAVSLLWTWLMQNPDYYMSYVAPYTQLRYIGNDKSVCAVKVGGHYRRKEGYRWLVPSLSCVCKFERLCRPRGMGVPVRAARQRWDEDGRLIPMRERVLIWH